MPDRKPSWRDKIILELQAKGFSRRKARKAVQTVLETWTSALAHGESVETPVGHLVVRASHTQHGRQKIQKIYNGPVRKRELVQMYGRRRRVVLKMFKEMK